MRKNRLNPNRTHKHKEAVMEIKKADTLDERYIKAQISTVFAAAKLRYFDGSCSITEAIKRL
jgi:hypothetical protein